MRRFVFSLLVANLLASGAFAQSDNPDVRFRWSLHPFAEVDNPGQPEEPEEPGDPEEPGPEDPEPEEPGDPDDDPLEFDGDFANAGFESACSGWSGNCGTAPAGEPVASGLSAISSSPTGAISQAVSLAGDETSARIDRGTLSYQFSFYSMSRGNVVDASLIVQWIDESGSVLAASTHTAPVGYFWQRQVQSGPIPTGSRSFRIVVPTGGNDRRFDHMSMGFFHGEVEVARMGEQNSYAVIQNADLMNWGAEDGDVRKTAVVPGWFALPMNPGSSTSQHAQSFAETSNLRQYHGGGLRSFRARDNVYGNVFAYQEVTLAAVSPAVATGQATINFSGFAATYRNGGSQPDRLRLQVELLDAENRVIETGVRTVEPAEITFYYQRFETPDVIIPPTAVAFRARFDMIEVSGSSVMHIGLDHLRAEVKTSGNIIKTYGAPTPGPVLGLPDFNNPTILAGSIFSGWGNLSSFGWYPRQQDHFGLDYVEMASNTQAQQFINLADMSAEIDTGSVFADPVIQFVTASAGNSARACRGSRNSPVVANAIQALTFFDVYGRIITSTEAERLVDYGLYNANHYGIIAVPAGARTMLYQLSTRGLGATGRCNVRNVGVLLRSGDGILRRLGVPYDRADYFPQQIP